MCVLMDCGATEGGTGVVPVSACGTLLLACLAALSVAKVSGNRIRRRRGNFLEMNRPLRSSRRMALALVAISLAILVRGGMFLPGPDPCANTHSHTRAPSYQHTYSYICT